MVSPSSDPSPPGPDVKPARRRTSFMVKQENKRILDYILGGASDRQICEWLNLSQRNYRKRIATLQREDMKQTIADQTPEARAFTLQRILEKIQNLEIKANQIMQSKTTSARDQLEAGKFLLSIYEDEYSLKEKGPLHFINSNASLPRAYQDKAVEYREALRLPSEEPQPEPDPNTVQ